MIFAKYRQSSGRLSNSSEADVAENAKDSPVHSKNTAQKIVSVKVTETIAKNLGLSNKNECRERRNYDNVFLSPLKTKDSAPEIGISVNEPVSSSTRLEELSDISKVGEERNDFIPVACPLTNNPSEENVIQRKTTASSTVTGK